MSCNLCHVNPTGTGLRNYYGISVVSQVELPARPAALFPDYSGIVQNIIRVGGDLRIMSVSLSDGKTSSDLAVFPMQAAVYASLAAGKTALLLSFEALRGDFGFQLHINNIIKDVYIKTGWAKPAYGLVLDDHTAFIRGGNIRLKKGEFLEGMPFTPFLNPTEHFEIGRQGKGLNFALSASRGFISAAGITYNGRLEIYPESGDIQGLAGLSILQENDLKMAGIFGGISLNEWSWMGEIDMAENWFMGTSLASYSELVWNYSQGWELFSRFEIFDADLEYKNDAIQRMTFGLNYVPLPLIEVKFHTRFSKISEEKIQLNPDYLAQLHIWF
ncbi:MAG: hypothetical protein V3S48_02980 [Candidatus Neomarinimicrobiota bacterium]